MSKKVSLGSTITFMCISVLLTFMLTYVGTSNRYSEIKNINSQDLQYLSKLAEIDKKVREVYLGDIDENALADSIIDGYVRGIGDKYATYFPTEQFESYMLENSGQMVGIGVHVIYDNERDVIEIISVISNSPAERDGILPGDYIYKVGDELVSQLGYYAAIQKVKGHEGTEVVLTVLRDGKEITLTIKREKVETVTVKSRLINSNEAVIGYLRISEFNKQTPKEFKAAIEDLNSQGATEYIFDVRYNPGGDLEGIVETLDFLLPKGPIVRIVYKEGQEIVRYSDESCFEAPMVVLINGNTASAAELFASALRDYEIAHLMGETTYGKGTMQSVMRLPDNSGISISQAMYNPPYGDNYEGIGVQPHTEVKITEELTKNFYKLTDEEDVQLQAAIKYLSEN